MMEQREPRNPPNPRNPHDPRNPENAFVPVSFLRMEKLMLGEASPQERAALERDLAADPERAAYFRKQRDLRNPMDWSRLSARLHPVPARPVMADAGLKAGHNDGLLEGREDSKVRVDRMIRNSASFAETAAAWLNSKLPSPGSSRRAMAWSVAFAMLLVALPVSWMATQGESGIRFKGAAIPEISLEVGGTRIAPGQTRHVTTGEILSFAYRSVKPVYAQIWYSEDDGAPVHFEGKAETSLFWTPATAWQTAPERIRLEGNWRTQRILILASPKPVSGEDARRILTGNAKPGKGASILTFDLVQP